MIELYQNESCPECAAARRRLADLDLTYLVRSVPMDRTRRQRVIEAGGRPDIPLLFDADRGRTTYDLDEILNLLGAEELVPVDEAPEPGLARLWQREGERASNQARLVLGLSGIDYVCHEADPDDRDVPRLKEPGPAGIVRRGLGAIDDWARGFRVR